MLFTTFLLTIAVAAALVQGVLLLNRKPDAVATRVPYGFLGVLATIAALVGLGLVMS